MGFFLGVLLVFVLTAILLLFWLSKGNIIYLKLIGIIWLGVFGLFFLGIIVNFIKSKKELKKTDYYGQYIINRAYYKGKISTTAPYSSERLIVEMVQPYHVLNTNPTLYRSAWSFYLVFNSPKYN